MQHGGRLVSINTLLIPAVAPNAGSKVSGYGVRSSLDQPFNIEISENADDGTWSWIVSRVHGYGAGLDTREECEVLAQRHIKAHFG